MLDVNAPKRFAILAFAAVLPAAGLAQLTRSAQAAPPAASVQTFSVKVSSTKALPRGRLNPIGVTFETGQKTPVGSPRVPLRTVTVKFPAAIQFGPDWLVSCMRQGVRCSGAGSGTIAVGRATMAFGEQEAEFKTDASYSLKADRAMLSFWARRVGGAATTSESYLFASRYRRYGGQARFSYEVPVEALTPVDEVPGEFTSFVLAFPKRTYTARHWSKGGRTKEKRALLELARCPEQGLVFVATFTYVDGTKKRLTSRVPCTKA